MPSLNYNAELRKMLLDNFNEIRPLTDSEVRDDFLIWDRARRLFPRLEESLEDVSFVLLKNNKIISEHAIGIEYKQSDILRHLTIEETASCMANEYISCFCLSLLDAHVRDVEKLTVNWYDGQRRHYPKDPMQPSKRKFHGRGTIQFGIV